MNLIRTKLSKVKEIRTPHGKKVRWLISKEMGAPHFEMRHFTITDESQPSEEAHPWEHQVYVLSGEGIIKSGDMKSRSNQEIAIYIAPPNRI
jgi:quercetin dioxygenase-like cupin family protein